MIRTLYFSPVLHHLFIIGCHAAGMMNDETTEKITIRLPHSVYHALRNQAHQQEISLPEFIQRKIELKPVELAENESLADLPLREILARTAPLGFDPDERLDFFHG